MIHDEAMPRYVYVTAAEFGPVKIGSSAYPEKRRNSVRQGGPFLTVRATYLRPGDAMKIEFAAHKILRDKRRGRSEWFNCTVAEAMSAIEQAIAKKDAAK